MADSVRYIKAVGIHERFDLEQSFQPGVNIIHGKNGTGKTTLLHILANILNGDFERFASLPFETIEVHLEKGPKIVLRHISSDKIEVTTNKSAYSTFSISEAKENLKLRPQMSRPDTQLHLHAFQLLKPILATAYFPAFRTLIEASSDDDLPDTYVRVPSRVTERATINSSLFARRFFGDFVPWINYPSPREVSFRIANETQQALNAVATTDRQLLSKAFLDIFATLSEENTPPQEQPDPILEKINSQFFRLESTSIISDTSVGEEVYTKLRALVLSFRVREGSEDV